MTWKDYWKQIPQKVNRNFFTEKPNKRTLTRAYLEVDENIFLISFCSGCVCLLSAENVNTSMEIYNVDCIIMT
jgi:hypothetical protein